MVSIHASVKDATAFSGIGAKKRQVSIHASVKDATGVAPLVGLTTYVSIHASVKDATQSLLRLVDLQFCFNPRICKRCDVTAAINKAIENVSIHASVKDATSLVRFLDSIDPFQSTHL